MNENDKCLSPWFQSWGFTLEHRKSMNGKLACSVSFDVLGGKYCAFTHYKDVIITSSNIDVCKRKLDQWLTDRGYILLDEERYEKLQLLL